MKKKQAQKKTRIPEALGNRICGVRLYVFILVFNAGTHITLFLIHEQSVQNFFRLLLSFIFFIYPLYYAADTLWSLQPAVRSILSGKILINRKYYMNAVRKEVLCDALLPVTVSVPIYTESNEIIFKTLSESLAAVGRYREFSGKKANLVVSDDGLAPLLGGRCTKEKAEALVKAILSDASALTANEKKAAERIIFYRKHNITFIARPAAGRAGLFKKASNLNFTLKL